MKYEENILKYLDGALTDSESAELLHALSVSPEKRVILEQHLQLKDMVTSAQKPFTVPAELEQAMGRRFPAVALYNSEIALGPSSTVGSNGSSIISSFFSKRSARIAAAALLLLALSSYLAISTKDEGSVLATQSTANTTTTSNNSTNPLSSSSTSRADISSTRPSESLIHSTASRVTSNQGSIYSSQGNTLYADKRNISIIKDEGSNDINANVGANINNGSSLESYPLELALISSVGIPRVEPSTSIAMNSIGEPKYASPFGKKQDQLQVPVLLRFEYGMGQAYFRVNTSDAVQNTRIESAPLFGVDYIASPYFSLGLEGGSAGIAQVVPSEVYEGTSNVTRYVTSNTIEASNHFYTRLMARYTINPYDMFHVETGIGAGVAFDENAVPLIAATAALSYDLSQKLSMSFGASFAGTFSKVAAPVQSGEMPANNEAIPVGYIEENTPSSTTLFSPSLTFRFGLRIRPW